MPQPDTAANRVIRFGVFEADLAAHELRKRGVRVKLQEQPFRLLQTLLERPGEVVTREEIQQKLWPDNIFVDFDKSVSTAVTKIRLALDDSAHSPRFVETIPRVGYRFLASPQHAKAGVEIEEPRLAPASSKRWLWTSIVAAACAFGVVAANRLATESSSAQPVRRFTIAPEATGAGLIRGERLTGFGATAPAAVSPDGSSIAYASDEDPSRVWIYRFDRGDARPLVGTEGITELFWAPDSRRLAFFAERAVKAISTGGGAAVLVCALPVRYEFFDGGDWSPDGETIVFSARSGGGSHLYSAPASGGRPTRILATLSGLMDPRFLPSKAPALLITGSASGGGPHAVRLEDEELSPLADSGRRAVYSPTGHVLYLVDDALWAAPFSLRRLERTGTPFLIAANLGAPTVSDDGTIVAPEAADAFPDRHQLTIRDRTGKRLATVGPPLRHMSHPSVSPDGAQVAVSASDRESVANDIWLFSLDGSGAGRRVAHDRLTEDQPIWGTAGRELLFRKQSDVDRNADFFVMDIEAGAMPRPILVTEHREAEPAWSPDGTTLIYQTELLSDAEFDIHYRVRSSEGELGDPTAMLDSEFNEVHPQFSPNGSHVAYTSRESGVPQIYVRPFPAGTPATQVSRRGGATPRWSATGSELYWIRTNAAGEPGATVVAAQMDLERSNPVGQVRVLFESEVVFRGTFMYDVTPDGRFVTVEAAPDRNRTSSPQYLRVIENWEQLDPAAQGRAQ